MGSDQRSAGIPARPVRVLSVPKGRMVIACFLGPYRGLLTHWTSKRTLPCSGPEKCPPAAHRSRVIWKGYAPVLEWEFVTERWIPAVLEVTESLEHALFGRKLRGQVWALSRVVERDKGPVVATYSESLTEAELCSTFDVRPVLERFYHTGELLLDVPNPIPRQVVLDPHEARAPALVAELLEPIGQDKPIDPQMMARFREQMRTFTGNGKGGGK